MQILLKDILHEVIEPDQNSLKIQIYCDMDGVLVDMDGGFKKLSGGLEPEEYEAKNGKSSFWKLINRHPTFWADLEPMPDAQVLWKYLHTTFKNPVPVILSAGQGARVVQQKTDWIRRHIDPSVKVIIASGGTKKPEYVLNLPGRVTHILVDDTQKNIAAWDNQEKHRIAILHTNAADTISQLGDIQKSINEPG